MNQATTDQLIEAMRVAAQEHATSSPVYRALVRDVPMATVQGLADEQYG